MSKAITVRNITDETLERLRAQAKANGRSFEGQIRWILEKASWQNTFLIGYDSDRSEGLGTRIRTLLEQNGAFLSDDDLPDRSELQREIFI